MRAHVCVCVCVRVWQCVGVCGVVVCGCVWMCVVVCVVCVVCVPSCVRVFVRYRMCLCV